VAGALVIVVDGVAVAYLRRGERDLLLFSRPEATEGDPVRLAAQALLDLAARRAPGRRGMLLATIDGRPAVDHAAAARFIDAGFAATALGLQARTTRIHPTGYAAEEPPGAPGTGLASHPPGGHLMSRSDTPRRQDDPALDRESGTDQTDDRTPANEGQRPQGESDPQDAPGTTGDVDPDSAFSEIDRDDMLDE
jgi:hypothetical protein